MAQPQLPARNGTVQNHWSQTSDDLSTLCVSRGIEPSGRKKEEKIALLAFYDMNAPEDVVEKWLKQVASLTTLKIMGDLALEYDIVLSNPASRPATLTDILTGIIDLEKEAPVATPPPVSAAPVAPVASFSVRRTNQGEQGTRGSPFTRRTRPVPTADPSFGRAGSTRQPFFAPARQSHISGPGRGRGETDDLRGIMDSLSLGTHTINQETRDKILRAVGDLLRSDTARAYAPAAAEETIMSEEMGAAWSGAVEDLGDCAREQADVIRGVQAIGTSQHDLAQQMRSNVERLQLLHTTIDQVARDTRELVGAIEAAAVRSLELAEDVQSQGATLQNRAQRRYRDAKSLIAKLWRK